MLSLAGSQIPTSPEQLADALREGFQHHGISPREVRVHGNWPRAAELSIDLTGAQFSRETPHPKTDARAEPVVFFESLAIFASPFHLEGTPVQFDLRASDVECAFVRSSDGENVLQFVRTSGGSILVEAHRADLEIALKNIAQTVLAKQGADVKSARLELIDRGPRSLGFRAEITAKAFLMSARVTVTGQLDLDEQLNLRVSQLATSGDGMIASLASGFLRPRFAEIEQRTIPLAAYSFAGVTPHTVHLTGGESLRISAQFGA